MNLTVLRTTYWTRRTGYLGSGLRGQLTQIRVGETIAYVRESLRLHSSFHVSSSARLSLGGGVIGGKVVPGIRGDRTHLGASVLELAAPPAQWAAIAQAVAQADSLHRPVYRNRGFTIAWAQARFHDTKPH